MCVKYEMFVKYRFADFIIVVVDVGVIAQFSSASLLTLLLRIVSTLTGSCCTQMDKLKVKFLFSFSMTKAASRYFMEH